MVKAESIPSWDLLSRVQKLEDSMVTKSDAKEMEERLEERADRKMAEMEERADRKMAEMEERSDRKMAKMEERSNMKMLGMENRMLVMSGFSSLIGIVSRYIGRARP